MKAVFVRWLDAFLTNYKRSTEEMWAFEKSPNRQVAVEALINIEPNIRETGYFRCENYTKLSNVYYSSRRYTSYVQESNYGLLVDVRNSTFIRLYKQDVYSKVGLDGKLFPTRASEEYTEKLEETKEFALDASSHTEAFFESPSYCAIVIKKPIEEMNEFEASRVNELLRITNLPIVDFSKFNKIENRGVSFKIDDLNFGFQKYRRKYTGGLEVEKEDEDVAYVFDYYYGLYRHDLLFHDLGNFKEWLSSNFPKILKDKINVHITNGGNFIETKYMSMKDIIEEEEEED